jgi:hypothetical protein
LKVMSWMMSHPTIVFMLNTLYQDILNSLGTILLFLMIV